MAGRPPWLLWDRRLLEYDFGPSHPFQVTYRGAAAERLAADRDGWNVVGEIPTAPRDVLERFHRRPYLDLVHALSRSGAATPLDQGDTPSFRGCYEAAARVVEATREGAEAIAEGTTARAFAPCGGLHHAHAERASGFCIFNDLAVAIASTLRPVGPLARVAYVDLDAHHGDGVMYGFFGDGRLLDIDVHQDGRTIFPGTGSVVETGTGDGAGRKVNLPLPRGAGDGSLVPLIRRVAVPLIREFRPEMIVVQNGVDGHVDDGLAGLEFTDAGYAAALDAVLRVADEVAARGVLVTGGGGYHRSNVTRVLEQAGRQLAGEPPGTLPEFDEDPWVDPLLRDLTAALGRPFPAT